jgi:hypothetical protein
MDGMLVENKHAICVFGGQKSAEKKRRLSTLPYGMRRELALDLSRFHAFSLSLPKYDVFCAQPERKNREFSGGIFPVSYNFAAFEPVLLPIAS